MPLRDIDSNKNNDEVEFVLPDLDDLLDEFDNENRKEKEPEVKIAEETKEQREKPQSIKLPDIGTPQSNEQPDIEEKIDLENKANPPKNKQTEGERDTQPKANPVELEEPEDKHEEDYVDDSLEDDKKDPGDLSMLLGGYPGDDEELSDEPDLESLDLDSEASQAPNKKEKKRKEKKEKKPKEKDYRELDEEAVKEFFMNLIGKFKKPKDENSRKNEETPEEELEEDIEDNDYDEQEEEPKENKPRKKKKKGKKRFIGIIIKVVIILAIVAVGAFFVSKFMGSNSYNHINNVTYSEKDSKFEIDSIKKNKKTITVKVKNSDGISKSGYYELTLNEKTKNPFKPTEISCESDITDIMPGQTKNQVFKCSSPIDTNKEYKVNTLKMIEL